MAMSESSCRKFLEKLSPMPTSMVIKMKWKHTRNIHLHHLNVIFEKSKKFMNGTEILGD